jgi:transposase-like protein
MSKTTRKFDPKRFTFKDFEQMFPDDDTCLEWLRNHLYPDGIYCKVCKTTRKHHKVASRKSYSCDHCGHHVHPTAGTIFHKSSTSLKTWFHAIYLMASTRCGVSAKQIERQTGVTYKTAWRMFKQIRSLLQDTTGPVGGAVEMDETYIGGRRKLRGRKGSGRPAPGDKTKRAVVGIVQRGGRARAFTVDAVNSANLLALATEHILPESTVYTDELNSYDGLTIHRNEYNHRRIHHRAKVYVVGDIHTNSVEGFWSLIKRGLSGVYHCVSHKYLQMYLDEYSFRYSHRFTDRPMFEHFLNQVASSQLSSGPAQSRLW